MLAEKPQKEKENVGKVGDGTTGRLMTKVLQLSQCRFPKKKKILHLPDLRERLRVS